MREAPLELDKGDFVRVTGKLKSDFYLSREGKPTGTLLVIAFEAQKISKPTKSTADVSGS
jgi:single-stranded DNA-binding protein